MASLPFLIGCPMIRSIATCWKGCELEGVVILYNGVLPMGEYCTSPCNNTADISPLVPIQNSWMHNK
jgi:hypothetical protein